MIFYTITTTGVTLAIFIEYFIYALIIIGGFGLVGLFFAYLISSLLNKVFPSELDYFLASFAILMSVFVGIISGFIPSYRAANLDPIDSLRYE